MVEIDQRNYAAQPKRNKLLAEFVARCCACGGLLGPAVSVHCFVYGMMARNFLKIFSLSMFEHRLSSRTSFAVGSSTSRMRSRSWPVATGPHAFTQSLEHSGREDGVVAGRSGQSEQEA
jgi:hypothetical protein